MNYSNKNNSKRSYDESFQNSLSTKDSVFIKNSNFQTQMKNEKLLKDCFNIDNLQKLNKFKYSFLEEEQLMTTIDKIANENHLKIISNHELNNLKIVNLFIFDKNKNKSKIFLNLTVDQNESLICLQNSNIKKLLEHNLNIHSTELTQKNSSFYSLLNKIVKSWIQLFFFS